MNKASPGILATFGRRRLITCCTLTSRSDKGLRLTNSEPRFTDELNPETPTEEPTPETAGSEITISAAFCCRSYIAWKEVSGDAKVPA